MMLKVLNQNIVPGILAELINGSDYPMRCVSVCDVGAL